MKYCPKCGHNFPDKYRFCQYDRIALVEVSEQQPVANVSAAVASSPDPSPVMHRANNEGYSSSANTMALPARPESSSDTAFTQTPIVNIRLWAIIAGATVLVLMIGIAVYILRGNPVEKKLDETIAKGNLLTPPGANAYELYHQLKLEGASSSALKKFDDKLLPILISRPQNLLTEFAKVGSKDPSPAEWEEAEKLLTWASEIKPNDNPLAAKAAYCTGRIAYVANRKDDALESWKRASELDSSWALPINGVGLIYNERKDYSTARGYLLEATRRNPNWAVPYNNLGTSYFYVKDLDQAEYYYNQVVERDSRWARPHAWLGAIAMQRHDYNRAVSEFESVLHSAATGTENIDLDKISQQLELARQLSVQTGGNNN